MLTQAHFQELNADNYCNLAISCSGGAYNTMIRIKRRNNEI